MADRVIPPKTSKTGSEDPSPNLLKILCRQYSSRSPGQLAEDFQELIKIFKQVSDKSKNAALAKQCSDLIKCCKCQSDPGYLLNCKHLLCRTCFLQPLNVSEQTVHNSFAYFCPVCNFKHSSHEMNILAESEWRDFVNSVLNKRLELGIDWKCFLCNEQKSKSFFHEKHYCAICKVCLECLADITIAGNIEYRCGCGKRIYVQDYIHEIKGICHGCNRAVYVVGDYLTRICEDHFLCFDCLKIAEARGCCRACGMALASESSEKIKKKMRKKCKDCGKEFENPLFMKKTCCGTNVCVFCQSKNKEFFRCVSCQANLKAESLEMVLEVQAVIENYSLHA